ncbi:MAG: L,D-transpeptidase family protein [Clostridia bacterium]|nr:L,D-transpeptidase family protein [Clostridia bacterium]
MKRVICFCICVLLTMSGAAFAEKAEQTETEIITDALSDIDAKEENNAQTIEISVAMIPRMQVIDSVAVFELFDENGEKLGEAEEWIGGITSNVQLQFNVSELKAGDKFVLKLKSGLVYLKYYEDTYGTDEEIVLETYGYLNESGEPQIASSFALEGCPMYEHAIVVYAEGNQLKLNPRARLIDDITMVPVREVSEALGIEVMYDEAYNSVVCSVDDKTVIFNVGTAYATIFGVDTYLPRACEEIDDKVFVPVRPLAEAFGSEIETFDFGDHIDVCLGESTVVREARQNLAVNRWGLSSRTNYLVWIDKSDYLVRVYTGSKNKWKEVAAFPCAIGAPGSPTITGSYEYQYRMEAWYYDGYYVGPCLVFHGNYAMHSTLLGYNGVPYDNRTGVMISHGCVRLRKEHIDWLDRNLPRNSRIYITE